MKKLIIALSLALVTALAFTTVAFAQSQTEEEIEQLALQNDKVQRAECLIYNNNCVIAVKTEKFTTQSQYQQYVDQLVEQVKSTYKLNIVFVTRNPKVMHEIVRLETLPEAERNAEIEKLLDIMQQRKPIFPHD